MRWLIICFLCFRLTSAQAIELSIKVDTFGVTTSVLKGRFHGSLIIQQFRWNEWCNVDTLGMNRLWNDTCVEGIVHLHGGENQVRVMAVPTNPYVYASHSSVSKITTTTVCRFDGKCNHIGFTVVTYWEVRDKDGVVLKTGYSRIVNTDGLPKGGYYLFFDNSRSEFFKQ